ncbi:MAG: hypothetical protein KDE19_20625 [Caldilineaceae bacterium]|nr:hypothetical protein [Caldilineaceae bacterium]
MSVKVTLELPNGVIEHAARYGRTMHRAIEDVLADSLESLWPILDQDSTNHLYDDVSELSDEEVLALANLKMSSEQNDRLGALQSKGKEKGLNQAEQVELLGLMQIYRLGMVRKSQGLAEAVRRGIREPLHP